MQLPFVAVFSVLRMRVAMPGLVLMLRLELGAQRLLQRGLLFKGRAAVVNVRCFRQVSVLQYMHLGAGDAAAVHTIHAQGGADVERGGGPGEDLQGNTGVQQSAKKHVAGDPGKAVKVGNAHERKTPGNG